MAQAETISSSIGPRPPDNEVWKYTYDIVNTYPHQRDAFTEGLVFLNGNLFESTGLEGQSKLREVALTNGRVLREIPVKDDLFGEGLALLNGKAYQLTWKAERGFVYDQATFKLEREFHYAGEGWGMTTDGHLLIESDGTPEIKFFDPSNFTVVRSIQTTVNGQPLKFINELELIRGELFANVWQTPCVVRINPTNGIVTGVISFEGLLTPEERQETDVLNGIAYDDAHDRLFVTGKKWPKLFEVRLKRVQ